MLRIEFVVMFLFLLISPVSAAEFKLHQSQAMNYYELWKGKCSLSLTGKIEKGDVKRFQHVLNKIPSQDHDANNFMLCLNSKGGDLEIGLKIGAMIRKNYLATYVPENSKCLSACAVAFMHGGVAFFEDTSNHRMMHPNAVVGFHRPSLDIGMPDNTPIELVRKIIEISFNSAIDGIAGLTENALVSSNLSRIPIMPLSLISAMLRVPSNDFLYIDTLERAFAWDIQIYPNNLIPPPNFILKVGYYQLCENAFFEIQPQHTRINLESPRVRDVTKRDVEYHEDGVAHFNKPKILKGYHFLTFSEPGEQQCVYKYEKDELDRFRVIRYSDGIEIGRAFLPAVYLFPPSTKISTLTN